MVTYYTVRSHCDMSWFILILPREESLFHFWDKPGSSPGSLSCRQMSSAAQGLCRWLLHGKVERLHLMVMVLSVI